MPDLQSESAVALNETCESSWVVPPSFAAFDADTLTELVELYLEDTSESLRRLREAYDAGDSRTLGRLAHTLKGSSRNFHVASIASACEAIENLSRDSQIQPVAPLLHAIEDSFPSVAANMRHVIAH